MSSLLLEDGSRVGVIGGGPAGSLFAYFLLTFADRMDMDIGVDVYEPRDFTKPGPGGCNMCGGIVSESLVQSLAIDGIHLPDTVVQRGIDSYVLHTDESVVRIDTPLREQRIAAIHRGGGPRDLDVVKWGGLDGYLLSLARERGATVVPARVQQIDWDDGRPRIAAGEQGGTYDLLVGATGINSSAWQLYEQLGFQGSSPTTTKAYITEIKLGNEAINAHLGNSMHIFFLNDARLDSAAVIPKGDYATVCLLGEDIDRELIDTFFAKPSVRECFPDGWSPGSGVCHCSPKINITEAERPFIDRVVLIGDSGATRLYKDGIGASYRTAKAAARTAIFSGISTLDFERHYLPVYRSIAGDNSYGKFMFRVVHYIKRIPPAVRGVVRMSSSEQRKPGAARRMSMVLWDMFTGSQPYREIFFRTLDPRFWLRFGWESARSLRRAGRSEGAA